LTLIDNNTTLVVYSGDKLFKINHMFELSKQVLQKVSFDRLLFKKELSKSINWLKKEEITLLKVWCMATFGHLYRDLITETFETAL